MSEHRETIFCCVCGRDLFGIHANVIGGGYYCEKCYMREMDPDIDSDLEPMDDEDEQ